MGRYVKETCPNCKNVISGWHNDPGNLKIGDPLLRCSKCGTVLVRRNIAEYVMFDGITYIRYFIWTILGDALLSFFVGAIIATLLSKIVDLEEYMFAIIVCIVSLSLFVFLIIKTFKIFKQEKKESLERTSDKAYLKDLYNAKLISERKYKEMVEYYKNN